MDVKKPPAATSSRVTSDSTIEYTYEIKMANSFQKIYRAGHHLHGAGHHIYGAGHHIHRAGHQHFLINSKLSQKLNQIPFQVYQISMKTVIMNLMTIIKRNKRNRKRSRLIKQSQKKEKNEEESF